MNKVHELKIGDLVEFQRGYDLPKSEFKKGKVPVISSNGVLGFHNEAKVKAPGITIGRSGTVGLPHYITDDFFPHNTSLFIKDFKGNNEKYIFYLLRTLNLNEFKSGSGVPTLNRNHLHPLSVWATKDLLSQQKIAEVLSALDDKIELNNKINAELEAMTKTLYDYWFVQFDFPDANGKPYKSSGGKMVYNEILKRQIPEGWEVKSLFQSADVQYGFPFSTEFFNEEFIGNPVIRIRDITDNSISTFSSEENVSEKYLLKKGDVLIGMDGNFHINYWSRENCYLNQRVVRIRKKMLANILIRYQIEPYIQLRERSVSRTTVAHLSDKDLKAINITLPVGNLRVQANKSMDGILDKITSNNQQNLELSTLRDWLLPMLMNGQVSVGKVYKEEEEVWSMAAEDEVPYQTKIK